MDKTHRVIWILILHNFIKDISIKNIIFISFNTFYKKKFNPQGIYKSIHLIVFYIVNGNIMYDFILPEIVVIISKLILDMMLLNAQKQLTISCDNGKFKIESTWDLESSTNQNLW